MDHTVNDILALIRCCIQARLLSALGHPVSNCARRVCIGGNQSGSMERVSDSTKAVLGAPMHRCICQLTLNIRGALLKRPLAAFAAR